MTQDSNHTIVNGLRAVIVATMMSLTGSHALADGVVVKGNVYGGGNLADVKTNTEVNISTGTVEGSVFGGGKGKADNFTCDKAMVGIGTNDDGVTFVSGEGENAKYELKPGGTTVTITNGTVEGDVYGGGEVGRVERNTIVTIGIAGDNSLTPVVKGHVFGAGKGVETHGYSALVRGNATVTIQGKAAVWQNVHGGGEKASVGRYYVAQNQTDADTYHVRIGMPCYLKAGGKCTVNIQDEATIGKEANTGDVYGAGQGVTPDYNNDKGDADRSKRMVTYSSTDHQDNDVDTKWNYYVDEEGNEDRRYVWEYFATNDDYLKYVETLGRASETDVVIGGKRETTGESPSITASENAPIVKGTVYGGSESGFVYYSTAVNMLKGTVNGDVFGGGKGLLSFAEAGRVRINTNLTISDGTVDGSVYGGGSLGDVGRIKKNAKYNYLWTDTPNADPDDPNSYIYNNTGVCNVTINGGTIGTGVTQNSDGTFTKGNVYGAGRGSDITWWCEKAIAYATNVTITAGTVNGTVYGGGQVGRVEDDAKVVIGVPDATGDVAPTIMGSVFGAGAGLHTHGYSALVRGNSDVIVQGTAQVGGNVYGGGETASVGRFTVVGGLPKHPDSGGYCTVTIQDNAKIGTSGLVHNVFGACKGVDPADISTSNRKSMQLRTNAPDDTNLWSSYNGDDTSPFIWRYYATDDDYSDFLKTLALTSHPHVTISENATVYGSVYGGGQRGVTLGNVVVDITGGTIEDDVYGGGALADTNCGNWDADSYTEVDGLTAGESVVTGLYIRTGTDTANDPYVYTEVTVADTKAVAGTIYCSKGKWHDTTQMTALYTTTVDLTGGTIKGDAYGGGLGQKTGFYDAQNTIATKDIEAVVWGDINVTLGGGSSATSFYTTYENDNTGKQVIKSGRVFGCNNLLGSPQGDVTVTVWRTVAGNGGTQERTTADVKTANKAIMDAHPDDYETVSGYVTPTYEVAAVYGGGNLAPYEAAGKKAHVIINGCDATSIQTVYGGGNAAAVPETDVDINSCYEIGSVFGGGNGKDKYKKGNDWTINPGANVNGNASTLIYGGTVHEAYGGSNEKGTIHGSVVIDIADSGLKEGDDGYCALDVAKLVGAGKNADVNGDLKLIMGCKPETKIPLVYGGADNANVNGDVELTITSGNFGKVIGGNNNGGVIKGHIILNIEETTCIPINIDHLYLCGYNAPYSQYGYYVKTTTTEGTPIGNPSETAVLTTDGKLQFIPRESADDLHLPVNTYSYSESGVASWTVLSITGDNKFEGYEPPVLNVISCTSIGEVFGGGYGTTATVYGNPTVNINMTPGAYASSINRAGTTSGHALGEIGVVYGGGDAAKVCGNTTVNIGTKTTVPVYKFAEVNGEYKVQYEQDEVTPQTETKNVEGAYITGDVYGGGKLADVTGNTYVNVCAEQVAVLDANNQPTGEYTYNVVNITGTNYEGVTIGGNVYGGGEGYAKMEKGTAGEAFLCAKAMIGIDGEGIEDKDGNGEADHPEGGTSVVIGNGTVGTLANGTIKPNTGNVYGGGKLGRVEKNTKVTIGIGDGTGNSSATSKPVILGNVFGAGAGVNTHGYSALVRGTSTVLVEGDAKVKGSVYGGGEIASVGRYKVVGGLPQVLNNALAPTSGYCYVTIRGYAEIGPDDMEMTKSGGPSDAGHVFGAGQGVLPYDGYDDDDKPFHMNGQQVLTNGTWDGKSWEDQAINYPAYVATQPLDDKYAKFIKSLALATETLVTIEGNPFIKGSVYGGSENGYVQKDSRVVISGGQIGNGYVQMDDDGNYLATKYSVNRRYSDEEWADGHLIKDGETNYAHSLPECASWPYGETITVPSGENTTTTKTIYAPYDKYAMITVGHEEEYEMAYDVAGNKSTNGGRRQGSDGHTFYGNVFGGGSGYYPYKPGRWFEDAGAVYGDTYLTIKGGHILTSVYGGNEMTDVGKYDDNDRLKLLSGGNCYVTMIGGTLGVPRTLGQIDKHPVTCYLFGAGKGDQRVFFNKLTNVGNVYVHISDDARIYGSVFGGGEDGHVMKNVEMNIGGNTLPAVYSSSSTDEVLKALNLTAQGTKPVGTSEGTITHPYIGTWGTSYVDGNVFGGGRGFGGDAYTAGNVAGTVTMNIYGGTMLGSVYGGGRLGSVGYGLFDAKTSTGGDMPGYGEMRPDNTTESQTGESSETSNFPRGYVYMTIGKDDGTGPIIGNTLEYIVPSASSGPMSTGDNPAPTLPADIKDWLDENWTAWKKHNNIPKTEFDTTTGHLTHTKGGNVFAGGMGRLHQLDGTSYFSAVDWWKLGCVKSTTLTIKGGTIRSNVYGGGELGQVVEHHVVKDGEGNTVYTDANNTTAKVTGTEITIQGINTVIGTEVKDASNNTQYTFGSVFGGGYGSLIEKKINGFEPKSTAGLVKEDTKIDMQGGAVKASIYGGGEMASVGKIANSTAVGSTYVSVRGGTVGIEPITLSDNSKRYFGGAKMGNVYGGGSGHGNTVRSGKIFNSTNVTISDGIIYHNVYGGGAYGTVGDFAYSEQNETVTENGEQITVNKVSGISDLATKGTGVATVTITGGTIGYDGKENGMVFGSSRGDINQPGARDDYTAWVYDTHVTIGDSDSETGPQIKGTVYGSGENGHVFHDTEVNVYSGTIGIASGSAITYTENGQSVTKGGAEYPYRGNVYGGGCGTDKYYSDPTGVDDPRDGNGDTFNPLAGIVYGTTTVNINGGTVVRNVYGAGAMGSVGRTVTTTNTDNSTTTTITGGTTTINVSGGTIGVDGTDGVGNVFGAARGDEDATITESALVRKSTSVLVTGGTIEGNVYGGGELGCVGTFTVSDDMRTFTWKNTDGTNNTDDNSDNKNTGICNVTVNGSSAVINGHVYGAGKGKEDTFWCEKGIAYSTNVNVKNGTVNRNVYGGGEVGRVETDTQVKIGNEVGTAGGTIAPTIMGSIFGGGAGVETHGYSALVRRNTTVTVEGNADVRKSIYGGGMIASVGRYGLDENDMPSILQGGGYCYVTVQGSAQIGEDVFGAGKGVTPAYIYSDSNEYNVRMNNSKRMVPYSPYNETTKKGQKESDWKKTWDYVEDYPEDYSGIKFVWEYFDELSKYSTYLETLALATHPEVTIDGNATVSGSVFGGGELGLTKGSVIVTIKGGTIEEDVYGGGSLANTNTTSTVDLDGDGTTENIDPTTTVNLKGGTINRNVYGGGLGRLAKEAQGTEGEEGYQSAVSEVKAKVYGEVLVELNKPTTTTTGEGEGATTTTTYGDCEVKGTIFGCNNLNGSPQKNVTVHVYKTVTKSEGVEQAKPTKNTDIYEVTAVYGGGNLAAYYPDDATARETAIANVIIDGCDLTSIKSVYGGGNAASVPATEVVVNGTYEIGEVFGGGNGADPYTLDNKKYINPGANVGYTNYTTHTWSDTPAPGQYEVSENSDASTLNGRAAYAYGIGKAHATIYGGTVHNVYGGSNTRGNVRVESRTTLEDLEQCTFNVGDAFGGGNNADQDGDAILDVGCIRGLDIAYGGASYADVNGDVILNLTNGTYGRVFGGNNLGGAIRGSIKVNIEETGCNPIVIGELYCGGNEAAYSVYGYNDDGTVKETGSNPVPDPVLNVKSFTSIGKIFGGGYGARAKMVASPTVNINVIKGRYSNEKVIAEGEKVYNFDIPSHESGAIGAIGSVFGGGNAAEVIGTPHVNIGTKVGEVIPLVSKPIEDSEGRTPSAVDWTPSYQLVTVEGVDIRDNVYGAGNNAQVTGNTEVVIGKNNDVKTYSFTSYSASNGGDVWSSGLAQTTGKYVTLGDSKLAEVEILTNGKYDEYVGKKFYVDPKGSGRLQLYNADKEATSLWVSIEPFAYKTYSFKSYGASSGGTEYSTGTAAPTGNFKEFDGTEYMQIVVLTNPGEASWVGKTFYVPANAETNGNARTQLHKANGDPVNVWVSIEL